MASDNLRVSKLSVQVHKRSVLILYQEICSYKMTARNLHDVASVTRASVHETDIELFLSSAILFNGSQE